MLWIQSQNFVLENNNTMEPPFNMTYDHRNYMSYDNDKQYTHQVLNLQKAPQTSASLTSSGVSFASISEKNYVL